MEESLKIFPPQESKLYRQIGLHSLTPRIVSPQLMASSAKIALKVVVFFGHDLLYQLCTLPPTLPPTLILNLPLPLLLSVTSSIVVKQ